jgi:peptide chain release factor 2
MYEAQLATVKADKEKLADLRACLNVEDTKIKIGALEAEMSAPGFWDNSERAQEVVQSLKSLKGIVTAPEEIADALDDLEVLIEMAEEEEDSAQEGDINSSQETVQASLAKLELSSLFMDPRDSKTVILSVHPGAGGTESCDWAEMLLRMILRFCERNEFKVEILEYQAGDEAGLKSATLRITGENAYGTFKSEAGVHRLVRISPYDSAARRHTSFSAVEVLTEIDDTIEIEIREDDLKMDVYRSSGAGGQKVNKTSSAVRLTHMPTGLVVACQIERSQHRNRDVAMQMLKSKLYDIEQKKLDAELDAQRDGHQEVAWGSQIRSYVLHPYQMIKDHRTNFESGSVTKVLDGDLAPFMTSYLKWNLENRHRTN